MNNRYAYLVSLLCLLFAIRYLIIAYMVFDSPLTTEQRIEELNRYAKAWFSDIELIELPHHHVSYLPNRLAIRYPYEATSAERTRDIETAFPRILFKEFKCQYYVVIHPDEHGLPTVSNGGGDFNGERDVLKNWNREEMEELIVHAGYTPGEVMHDYRPKPPPTEITLTELNSIARESINPLFRVAYYRDGIYVVLYPYPGEISAQVVNDTLPLIPILPDYKTHLIVQHHSSTPPTIAPGVGESPWLSSKQRRDIIQISSDLADSL